MHSADVVAIDGNSALGQVIEAAQEVDDGGLPGPGRPDQCDRLARRSFQVDVDQDRFLRLIGEADMVELDRTLNRRQRFRLGQIRHGWPVIQYGKDPFRTG